MNLKEIQHLIKFVAKSGASEVKLELEDFKITIKTTADAEGRAPEAFVQAPVSIPVSAATPQAVPVAPAPSSAAAPTSEEDQYITVKSPIIGTFYRKPSPDKPNFVEVGQDIKEGDVLCVIEAMKLFNEIESELTGKIVKILVDDSSPVEFDQPLFLVDPA